MVNTVWTFGGPVENGDVHAIYRGGRHITIKIKIGKDRLSKWQAREAERITKAGELICGNRHARLY